MKTELEKKRERELKVQVSSYEIKNRLREMARERGELKLEDIEELAFHYAEQTDAQPKEMLVIIVPLNRERVIEGLDKIEKRADRVISTGASGITPARPRKEETEE